MGMAGIEGHYTPGPITSRKGENYGPSYCGAGKTVPSKMLAALNVLGIKTTWCLIMEQISSIATLGATDKWLKEVLFGSLCSDSLPSTSNRAKFSIIFPTADEIRRSLNGYGSGGSIHMKLQSAAQQKQLQYMRPHLCHWAGDEETPVLNPPAEAVQKQTSAGINNATTTNREAGRRRAAPHIKTYIRFSNVREMDCIDWAMVTSANLSTQAWGAAANANGEVRICSWEIGIIVWPDLFGDYPTTTGGEAINENKRVEMVPCFKQDLPLPPHLLAAEPDNKSQGTGINRGLLGDGKLRLPSVRVGFRMPYDLPLSPYSSNDVPWCATARHTEQDWLGQTWDN